MAEKWRPRALPRRYYAVTAPSLALILLHYWQFLYTGRRLPCLRQYSIIFAIIPCTTRDIADFIRRPAMYLPSILFHYTFQFDVSKSARQNILSAFMTAYLFTRKKIRRRAAKAFPRHRHAAAPRFPYYIIQHEDAITIQKI